MNSCTAWRCGDRRVGKIRLYQPLIMIARQSRACLSARSWADAQDLGRRVVPQTPGRKGDRGQQGLEMAGRQGNDQPSDLALAHSHRLGGDDLDVPSLAETAPAG